MPYRYRPLIIAIVFVLLAPAGHAQLGSLPGGGGSGSSEPQLIEREQVIENVTTAFNNTAQRTVDDILASSDTSVELSQQQQQQIIAQARDELMHNVNQALNELEGDGALTVGEVVEKLGAIRKESLNRLKNVLNARSQGYEPPPRPSDYDSAFAYIGDAAYYTMIVRNPWQRWLYLLLTASIGIIIALAIAKTLDHLGSALRSSDSRYLAYASRSIRTPLVIGAIIAGLYFGSDILWLPSGVSDAVSATFTVLIIFIALWIVWNLCAIVADFTGRALRQMTNNNIDFQVNAIVKRVLRIATVVVFAFIVAQFVFNTSVTGMIAGLGIVGVGLWFALNGLIQNITASFTIFSDRPFKIGDTLIYRGDWGKVEDIGFRSTRFRNLDGHLYTIPNDELIREAIQNAGRRPYIRRRFRIGITYDTPPDKVEQAVSIVENILAENDSHYPSDEPPHVVFETFGAYDLKLLVQYYYQPPEYWEALAFDDKINRAILRQFNDAEIKFAFPTQTTILETADQQTPQLRLVDESEQNRSASER